MTEVEFFRKKKNCLQEPPGTPRYLQVPPGTPRCPQHHRPCLCSLNFPHPGPQLSPGWDPAAAGPLLFLRPFPSRVTLPCVPSTIHQAAFDLNRSPTWNSAFISKCFITINYRARKLLQSGKLLLGNKKNLINCSLITVYKDQDMKIAFYWVYSF